MRKHVLLYGLLGGVLIACLKLIEYRWLVVEYSVEIYGGLVAAVFAALGIWLGHRLTGRRQTVVVREVLVAAPVTFVRDQARIESLEGSLPQATGPSPLAWAPREPVTRPQDAPGTPSGSRPWAVGR